MTLARFAMICVPIVAVGCGPVTQQERQLKSKNSTERMEAVQSLASTARSESDDAEAAIEALTRALTSSYSEDVERAAEKALIEAYCTHPKIVMNVMFATARKENSKQVSVDVDYFGSSCIIAREIGSSAVPHLVARAKSEEGWKERRLAVQMLQWIGPEATDAIPDLAYIALHDTNAEVREGAVFALGFTHHIDAAPAFARLP